MMLISRLIFILFILLDSCHIVFMHEIEEKFFASNNRLKNKSFDSFTNSTDMRVTPRLGGTGFGGLSYLAVSLLFQLPLMEIIFVMGLLILVLGIMLHFVELKADFFRLRRQFLREEKLRLRLEREEALRNQTLAQTLQGSNSSLVNGLNANPMNGVFNQNYGSDGTQSQSYVNYESNRNYGQHYSDDKLYAQSSQSYPSRRSPPNRYLQPKRFIRRRRPVNQVMRSYINSEIPQNINHQKLVRQRYPQRMVAYNRRQGMSGRPPNLRRRVGKK